MTENIANSVDVEAASKEPKTIHSIEKALDIIEYLYQYNQEANLRDICKATGLHGSTAHRILSTMKNRGYIHQNEKNAKYWLGFKFYGIGNAVKDNMPLAEIIEPYADKIARKYKQTVYTAMPYYQSDTPQQVIVYKVSHSPYIIRNSPDVGTIAASHGAATGKCMMAYYPEKLIAEYKQHPLPMLTAKTITDWNILEDELQRIRRNGYAMESDEEEIGSTCIAVPITDKQNSIIASVSLSGPTSMIFEFKINDILNDLREAATEVSAKF